MLAVYGWLTHTEIAAALDLPDGAVKGRMRVALHKLQPTLAPNIEQSEARADQIRTAAAVTGTPLEMPGAAESVARRRLRCQLSRQPTDDARGGSLAHPPA